MDGNVCLVTAKGYRFINLTRENTMELCEAIKELKKNREKGVDYQFVLQTEEGEVTCTDILVAVR